MWQLRNVFLCGPSTSESFCFSPWARTKWAAWHPLSLPRSICSYFSIQTVILTVSTLCDLLICELILLLNLNDLSRSQWRMGREMRPGPKLSHKAYCPPPPLAAMYRTCLNKMPLFSSHLLKDGEWMWSQVKHFELIWLSHFNFPFLSCQVPWCNPYARLTAQFSLLSIFCVNIKGKISIATQDRAKWGILLTWLTQKCYYTCSVKSVLK